jgi:L-asparaginase
MHIKIFSIGGTIDKVYFDKLSKYEIGFPTVKQILAGLPLNITYAIESLLKKDSLDMTERDRAKIRRAVAACPESKILITHGTDTMIETAKRLADIPGKTIVLTGAIEPAGFKSSDAVFNIGTAIGILNTAPEGVYIAMNGRALNPFKCKKNRKIGRFVDC